jgi:hypothetical protein
VPIQHGTLADLEIDVVVPVNVVKAGAGAPLKVKWNRRFKLSDAAVYSTRNATLSPLEKGL